MELGIFKEDDPRVAFIKYALRKRLVSYVEEGLEWIIISGQMGIEMWTAQVVLDLQDEYDIKLGIFPPFENQESRWPEPIQFAYQELLMCADFYEPIYKGEYKGGYQFKAKNLWFIEKSDACLLLIDDEYPGSVRFFYEEAKKGENYPIYTITPMDLDDAVTEMQMDDPNYWSS